MWWPLEYTQFALIRTVVNTSLYVRRSAWLAPDTQPDLVKTYGCRPNLFACRIFIPRSPNDGDELPPPEPGPHPSPPHTGDGRQTWPLVIRAHGGGFVVNNPAMDDPIARHLADHARCVVVSIDYSKAPQNKFPAAYEDVIAQSLAVVEDPDLPIDHNRVVLCGSSAGGNLVLGAVQDPRLRERVMGVVGIYAAVDILEDGAAKMATRPDPSAPDFIGDSYAGVQDLYLDAATKPALDDPRLSPTYFATRESLPPNVLLIGAEHDMFCHESEVMAKKIAAASDGSKVKTDAGWESPGVQWYKIRGQPHAFDAFPAKVHEKEKARVAAVEELYTVISKWLVDVFYNSDAL